MNVLVSSFRNEVAEVGNTFISIAIPPLSVLDVDDQVISTLVSLSLLNSVAELEFTFAFESATLPILVKLVPAVVLSLPVSFAKNPYVALLLPLNVPRVTVRLSTPVPVLLFVVDWTIAPEPFVPAVSIPVSSSTIHSAPVSLSDVFIVIVPLDAVPNALQSSIVLLLVEDVSYVIELTLSHVRPLPDILDTVGFTLEPFLIYTDRSISLLLEGEIDAVTNEEPADELLPEVKFETVIAIS